MLDLIQKFVGSGKFWLSIDKKEIEQDGAILKYGPTVEGSIECGDKQAEIRFQNILPTGTKKFLLGISATLPFDRVLIEESQITAFAGNRKFKVHIEEV